MKVLSNILSILFVTVSTTAIAQQDWKLVQEADNMTAYHRSISAGVYEAKPTAVLKAMPQDLAQLFMDVSRYPEWLAGCTQAEIVRTNNDGSMTVHFILATAHLGANQDIVANVVFSKNESGSVGKFTSTPDAMPVQAGITRVQNFTGFFAVRQENLEQCKISLQTTLDLGAAATDAVTTAMMERSGLSSIDTFRKMFGETLAKAVPAVAK